MRRAIRRPVIDGFGSGYFDQLGSELGDGFRDYPDAEARGLGDGDGAIGAEAEAGFDDRIAEGAFGLIELEGGRAGFESRGQRGSRRPDLIGAVRQNAQRIG